MLATKLAEDMGLDVRVNEEREQCMPIQNPPKRWRACFKMVDDDGDGKINANEMWELLIMRGYEIDKKTVCALLSIADRDGDEKITYAEFCAVKDGMVVNMDDDEEEEEIDENGALTLFEDEEGKLAAESSDDNGDDDFESDEGDFENNLLSK